MKPQPVCVEAALIRFGDRIYFPTNPRYPGDFQVLSNVPNMRDRDFVWLRLVSQKPYPHRVFRILIHKGSGVALTAHRK